VNNYNNIFQNLCLRQMPIVFEIGLSFRYGTLQISQIKTSQWLWRRIMEEDYGGGFWNLIFQTLLVYILCKSPLHNHKVTPIRLHVVLERIQVAIYWSVGGEHIHLTQQKCRYAWLVKNSIILHIDNDIVSDCWLLLLLGIESIWMVIIV